MSLTIPDRGLRRAVGWGVALAILWLVVVLVRNETTLHLAPLLVAGSPPVLNALDSSAAPNRQSVALAAVAGLVIAVMTAFIMIVTGNVDGPAISPFSSAVVETFVLAGIGAAGGLAIGLGVAASDRLDARGDPDPTP